MSQQIDGRKCPTCRSTNISPIENSARMHQCANGHQLVEQHREGIFGDEVYFVHPQRSGRRVFTSTENLPVAGKTEPKEL